MRVPLLCGVGTVLATFAGEADAVGLEAELAFAAVEDFLECFFVGDADASGVGLDVVSAARTSGTVAKAAKARRVISLRIISCFRGVSYIWQACQEASAKPWTGDVVTPKASPYLKSWLQRSLTVRIFEDEVPPDPSGRTFFSAVFPPVLSKSTVAMA